jgi:hypothetical protein
VSGVRKRKGAALEPRLRFDADAVYLRFAAMWGLTSGRTMDIALDATDEEGEVCASNTPTPS